MRRPEIFVLLVTLGHPGCAARSPVDVNKLTTRLEEMAQRESELQKQVDELNNRVFLLEDRVDTSRVAMERSGKAPELPVIRLAPKPEGDEPAGERASRDEIEGTGEGESQQAGAARSLVESKTVHYGGAASHDGPRPVLRLSGTPAASSSSASSSGELTGLDPSSVSEKLPVVPLPKKGQASSEGQVHPMREYNLALSRYQAGEYTAAADAFKGFLRRYGQHAYADNALYWMAECAYDVQDYKVALKLFRQVVEQYPNGNKAPDALLKMAYCYLRLKDGKNARTVLAQVMDSFPKSQVARLASETLAKMQ